MSDTGGLGIAASVFVDALDGAEGAGAAKVAAMGALKYHALYRWAPALASWTHERLRPSC